MYNINLLTDEAEGTTEADSDDVDDELRFNVVIT